MNINQIIVPYRINQARVSRGLSMSELADLVNVSKQSIFQYETGKSKPSDGTLNDIAATLKYSVSFFRKPAPANCSVPSGIFFRSNKTVKQKYLKASEIKIEILREINDYLLQYVDFMPVNLPKMDYDYTSIEPIGNDVIESYAKALREYWKLGMGPIENLMNVVQRNGIVVASTNFKAEKLDGLSEWYNNTPFIFMSRDKDTNCRIRFGIAHELGHLLMHAGNIPPDDILNESVHKKLEDEANRFAGAFLLPCDTFSKDVYKTSIDHFIQLKAKWKASLSSMIYRCKNLNILTVNQLKYLNDQMTQRVYWHHEPLDNEMPIERPFAHKQAITLLLDNNIIQPNEFVQAIGCYPDELEEYCCLDKGTLMPQIAQVVQLKLFK